MLIIYLFLLIKLTKPTYSFKKNSGLKFIHELNKNNMISFLDIPIDTNNNNNFTASTHKKTL